MKRAFTRKMVYSSKKRTQIPMRRILDENRVFSSEPVTFVCWKWRSDKYRQKFTAEHVNVWARGLSRCLKDAPHRMVCVTDDPEGIEIETYPLWSDFTDLLNPSGEHLPSCYRRLKLFSGACTDEMGIARGSHVVWMDLDVVFVNDVRPMFYTRDEPFVGWRGVGSHNDEVYNGTVVMFRAGAVEYLWDEFDPVESPRAAHKARYFGSDQAWLSMRMAGRAAHWSLRDGMFSYSRDVRPARNGYLPPMARIVSFNGKWKPWDPEVVAKAPWIKEHWR